MCIMYNIFYELWVISSKLMNCMGRTRKKEKEIGRRKLLNKMNDGNTFFLLCVLVTLCTLYWTLNTIFPPLIFQIHVNVNIIIIPLHHVVMQSIALFKNAGVMCTQNNYFDLNRWRGTFAISFIIEIHILKFICWWNYRYLLVPFSLIIIADFLFN